MSADECRFLFWIVKCSKIELVKVCHSINTAETSRVDTLKGRVIKCQLYLEGDGIKGKQCGHKQ